MAVRSYNIAEVKSDLYGRIPSNGEMELLLGENAINDSLPSWWQYDSASMAPDNFANGVIQPTLQTGAGRWIRYNIAMTLPQATSDLASKMNNPTGSTSQYMRGDGSLATFPTIPGAQVQSDWTASSGVTAIANKPTLGTASGANTTDFATSAQGAKADSALQPTGNGSGLTGLTKSQVGLSNVDNTSDASKPVSTAQAAAINAKFTTPTGNTSQYLRGDGSPATFPTIPTVKRQETYSGTTNASGVYTITYGTAYSVTPNVQFQVVGGSNKTTILITSSTTTGCSFKVELRADVLGLLPSYSNVNGASVDVLVTEK